MRKPTKYYLVVFLTLILVRTPGFAQYLGGSSDGESIGVQTNATCSNPPQFYAYFGGQADGASSNMVTYATCTNPPEFFAFFGGQADGASRDSVHYSTCPEAPEYYPYFGGHADGASRDSVHYTACVEPPEYYVFFGGKADGVGHDTLGTCSPLQPVANFSATPTTVCVGATVVFTDLSTNGASTWTWTFPHGTPSTSSAQNPSIVYNTACSDTVTLTASNAHGINTVTKFAYITVNICTSTGVMILPTELKVYPNPTNGMLNIAYADGNSKTCTVRLFDLAGQIVFTETVSQFKGIYQKEISLSGLANGMYYVQIITENGITNKKISKTE
jgi:PKD repeat protein